MTHVIDTKLITQYQATLNSHPLLSNTITTIDDVRTFMEFHVFAVWDFMCMVKALQHALVPSGNVWIPTTDTGIMTAGRLLNQIVTGEETDIGLDGKATSHFQLYRQAMKEIGADTSVVDAFIDKLTNNKLQSLNQLLAMLPVPSGTFCHTTFEYINSGKPHVLAAAFTFGRETAIPQMFINLSKQLKDSNISAPMFQYYMDRHIQIDSEEHGPASEELINILCNNNLQKVEEATHAALEAITHRINFWTKVDNTIKNIRLLKLNGAN
jgi:Protein of unknown function (DUF3050)